MEYKTALITGASAGIGREIARHLARRKVNLILAARRRELLDQARTELESETDVTTVVLDVSDQDGARKALESLGGLLEQTDILVNNAGLALGQEAAHQTNWQDWQTMIDTNCTGLALVTHVVLPFMVKNNRGHIINLGSTAGAYPYFGGNVYGATKAFVQQFSRNLRTDVLGTNIRVTNIAPGMVGESEFSQVRFHGDEAKARAVYEGVQAMTPADIANCVTWVLEQPAHVNINEIELMATAQAAGGLAVHRGKR